jgi:Zn-dependent M28 family amino/carboxypeptidase
VITTLFAAAVLAQDPAPLAFEERVRALLAAVDPQELERTVRTLAGFGTRHVLSSTSDPARGTGAARTWLEARLREIAAATGGRLTVERQASTVALRRRGLPGEVEVVNVVATLRGTSDPARTYVVGGHYDSRNSDGADGEEDAPGANDDASGTAVVLEACRLLSAHEFPATIVFVCYDGEEQGLLGSSAHATALVAANVEVDAMITNDIVGNTLGMDGVRRRDYLRCFSYSPRGNDSVGRSLARAATRAGEHVRDFDVRLVFRGDRYGRGGDHRPFAQEGFPAVRFTEAREDFSRQHQDVTTKDGKPYADLPEWVDFDYLADVARVNIALLAELAAAPRPPKVVRAQGANDRYDTLLRWEAVDGVAVYEAVWRDTTAPDWQGSLLLTEDGYRRDGKDLRAELPGVCLDDVVVGVRSVAPDGARSRVQAPPEPDALSNRPATGAREGR